jgi:hypothetical protein
MRWLERAGFRVRDTQDFPNRIGPRFVNGQLDVALRKTKLFRDRALAAAMEATIADVRARALDRGEVIWGADYVVAADAG